MCTRSLRPAHPPSPEMLQRIFSPAFSPAPWRSVALMILLVLGFTGLYTWATWQQVSKSLVAELSTVTELGEKSADHYFQLLHVSLSGLAEELQESPTADGHYDLERVRRYSRRDPDPPGWADAALDPGRCGHRHALAGGPGHLHGSTRGHDPGPELRVRAPHPGHPDTALDDPAAPCAA